MNDGGVEDAKKCEPVRVCGCSWVNSVRDSMSHSSHINSQSSSRDYCILAITTAFEGIDVIAGNYYLVAYACEYLRMWRKRASVIYFVWSVNFKNDLLDMPVRAHTAMQAGWDDLRQA